MRFCLNKEGEVFGITSTVKARRLPQSSTTNFMAKPFNAIEETLWVDRYRPESFAELLGNERVGRETMAWVKQWDWCVFGKGKLKQRSPVDDANSDDEYRRPKERVKLFKISGQLGTNRWIFRSSSSQDHLVWERQLLLTLLLGRPATRLWR